MRLLRVIRLWFGAQEANAATDPELIGDTEPVTGTTWRRDSWVMPQYVDLAPASEPDKWLIMRYFDPC